MTASQKLERLLPDVFAIRDEIAQFMPSIQSGTAGPDIVQRVLAWRQRLQKLDGDLPPAQRLPAPTRQGVQRVRWVIEQALAATEAWLKRCGVATW